MIRRASRFFARVTAAHLECPACGHVFSFSSGRGKAARASQHRQGKTLGWDGRSSTFTCWECGRVYVLGLLAWPIRRGSSKLHGRPYDQVPNPRQAAELRRLIGGYWMPEEEKRGRKHDVPTNIVGGECLCVVDTPEGIAFRHDKVCPIHGEPEPGGDEVGKLPKEDDDESDA